MSIPSLDTYSLPGSARLPKPRLDWALDPSRAALLIHDMQQYFLDFYRDEFTELTGNIARLRAWGIPTIYTAQPPRQDSADRGLLTDRWGPGLQDREAIVDTLAPDSSATIVTKHRYSAFHRTDLAKRLVETGRDQLVICGVYAHIGITATALDAFSHDFQPFVVADAVADFNQQLHLDALEHLAATCAAITTVNGLVGGLDLATVRAQVQALLDEPAEDDENLIDAGLDSIRVMGLIEDWQATGHQVTFGDLAADPTIRGFHAAIATSRNQAPNPAGEAPGHPDRAEVNR